MLIKSLTTKDFRQFKGEQRVEFSCDNERNVTVVLGKNTSGKSTLLQAFNWCLYGNAKFQTKSDLINSEVANNMNVGDKDEVAVEIVLVHNNTEYTITRTQEYVRHASGVRGEPMKLPDISYRQDDGQTRLIRAAYVQKTINEILPQELSSYFFFDAERIGSISNKDDVTEAVKGLLGLSVLQNAMRHLKEIPRNNVIAKFKADMDLAGNQKASDALARIQSLQVSLDGVSEQLSNVKNEIKHYETRKEQLEATLRDNQKTATLQRKKEQLERSIKLEEQELELAYDRFFAHFNKNTTCFFAKPLMSRALDFLKDAQVDDKGISDMTAKSIAEIIERGVCVCGAEILEGNEAYINLMKELQFLPPESIGTSIRNFNEKMEFYDATSADYVDLLNSYYQDIYRYKTRIQEWQDDVIYISDQIKGKENMERYESELVDVKRRLKEFKEKTEKLIRDDERYRREIEQYQKVYDSYALVSEKNKQISVYIKYAEELYSWIASTYRERESEIREQLELRVNDIFGRMYHGRRKVVIDDKYRVSLLTTYADDHFETDESAGLETVKNFAFVSGLMDLARDKITSKAGVEGVELGSEPYPLVMDAPFSTADEMHVSSICKVLPEIAEQVIMFIMQKDWGFAEDELGHLVGKEYVLDKKSETLTYIREVASYV